MTYKWDNKDLNPVPAITWNTPFMQQFWLLCVWAKWLSLPATGWTSGYFWVDRFTLLCHHLAKHVIVYGEFGKSIKIWSQPNFLLRPEVAWDEPGMGFLWAAQGYFPSRSWKVKLGSQGSLVLYTFRSLWFLVFCASDFCNTKSKDWSI